MIHAKRRPLFLAVLIESVHIRHRFIDEAIRLLLFQAEDAIFGLSLDSISCHWNVAALSGEINGLNPRIP